MLKDFFYLQRNDRQALIAILGVLVLSLSLVAIIGRAPTSSTEEEKLDTNHSFSKKQTKKFFYIIR